MTSLPRPRNGGGGACATDTRQAFGPRAGNELNSVPTEHQQQLDVGFLGLFIVQFVGAGLALRLTHQARDLHLPPCPVPVHDHMCTVVWVVLAVTVLVAVFQRDLPLLVVSAFGIVPKRRGPSILSLRVAVMIYFLLDFGALAMLIRATGGPERSLYTTFLYVLVPITIALQRQIGARTVVLFAVLTIGIFLATLWQWPSALFDPSDPQANLGSKEFQVAEARIHDDQEKHLRRSELGNPGASNATAKTVRSFERKRKCWLSTITIACVLFPTGIYLMQKRDAASSKVKAPSGDNPEPPDSAGRARTMTLSVRPGERGDRSDRMPGILAGDEFAVRGHREQSVRG